VPRPLPRMTPMPLVRWPESFDDAGWLYELKLDGFRALAYIGRRSASLVSRNGHVCTSFRVLAHEIAGTIKATTAIFHGEVVCLRDDGHPDFNALLFRRREPHFYAFDVLWLDGVDLRNRPLIERKRVLRRLVPRRAGRLRYLDHVVRRGCDLFAAVCATD